MGASSSSPLQHDELAEIQHSCSFSKDEILILYKRFQHLDKDNIGRISLDELHAIPELAVNPLASRIHAVFDLDNGGEINFGQFVSHLSVFSKNAKRDHKLNFAFRIYDVNADGFLDQADLRHIIKLMVGSNLTDAEIDTVVHGTILDADTIDRDGQISFAEFKRAMFSSEIEKVVTINF